MDNQFFKNSRVPSIIKVEIVSKYFEAWSKIMLKEVEKRGTGKVGYVDLFAGPGKYEDGTESTPLAVLRKAIANPQLARALEATFNDKDEGNAAILEKHILALPGIEQLTHKPRVTSRAVGEDTAAEYERVRSIPTLFFVDPWGYKGLSARLVSAVTKDWGCECVFFFNYNRVSAGIPNDLVQDSMEALFGVERAAELRAQIQGLKTDQKEKLIVDALSNALNAYGPTRLVRPFRFRDSLGSRTSHHIIHVSKHPLGYGIMKGIMAKLSSDEQDGVASLEYSPDGELDMFRMGLTPPMETLENELLERFAGESVSVHQIYLDHNLGTDFTLPNYKEVLKKLLKAGVVKVRHSKGTDLKPNTMPDEAIVTFPPKET